MEARRNLETILKRRLDESEKKGLHKELQLLVIKQYLTLDDFAEMGDISVSLSSILDKIEQLQIELKNLVTSRSHVTSTAVINYENAIKLSKLQLDQIHFHPESTLANTIIDLISHLFAVDKNDITIKEELRNECINLDYKILCKILRGVIKWFDNRVKDYKISLNHDKPSGLLNIVFSTEQLRTLLSTFKVAEEIFNDQITSQTVLNDSSVLIFIVKSLCQCTGGDAYLTEGNLVELTLAVSCEIVPYDQCSIDVIPNIHISSHEPLPVQKLIPIHIPVTPIKEIQHPTNQNEPIPIPNDEDIIPIPSSTNSSENSHTSSEYEKSLTGKVLKILLAEDGKVLQDLFKRYWKIKGHEVLVASNGQEAIEIFKSKTISIIFLDIEMPLKDGLTVAKEIRAFEKERQAPRTPIIGVSGYALKSYKEKALESGMDDFVSKGSGYPFKEIYNLVVKYCGE